MPVVQKGPRFLLSPSSKGAQEDPTMHLADTVRHAYDSILAEARVLS